MAINPIAGPIPSLGGASAAGTPSSSSAPGFGELVQGLVANAEGSVRTANEAVGSMLNQSGDVHDAMIALQQADIALQFTVQVRNKLVQAYQEIMRMPV